MGFAAGQRSGRASLAQALVDAGATTKPAAVVASILAAHAKGTALNRIASDMGIHHKTVSKIIDAAEDHQQRDSSRCDESIAICFRSISPDIRVSG